MANWLDKYEQGGMVLKKKTKDNYGKKPNVNDVQASVGPDFVGLGYNTKGRDYSPAWGGQFAMGGSLPGAVGFTYSRIAGSAPANGKYTKKTKASAQDGKKVAKKELTEEQYYNPPTPINKSGNTAMDMVSSNPWLMKVPILGNYIKDEAYRNAAMSEGFSTFAPVDTKQAEELMGKGYNAVGKYTGGGDEKYDLLKQYIYGDQNLQSSPYSPKDDYLKFLPSYSLKDKAGIKPQAYWKELILNNKYMDYSKDLENVVKTHKPKFYSQESDDMSALSRMYNTPPDLGHYKAGIGYDEDVNLPYVSVSDAWDFYPKDYQKMWSQSERDRSGDAYQQSYLMHKAGKPFKIYDRVYVDPKTKEPISDKEIIPKKLEKKFTPKGLSERVTQELHKGIDKSYNPYMQNGGEMAFYQNGLDFTPKSISKNGSVIKDDRGQWAYPGEITEIGSNNITMQGVDYPVLGVSDTGDTKMMYPDQDYKFDGEKVTEYPMAQNGIIVNDPKDPRLKKYQDSLNLYNKFKYTVPGGKNVPITQEEKRLFKDTETGIAPIYKQIYPGGKKEYFGNYPIPKQPVEYQAPKAEIKTVKGSKKYFINETQVDEPTFNKIVPKKEGMQNGGWLNKYK